MSPSKVRVRFAPSPTGMLHVGNARSALFNYLFARKYKGKFILRIEDTDIERSEVLYIDEIYHDLKWLGLDWDEGPDIGGENGPYRQSERRDIYKTYLKKLQTNDLAYTCYCSAEELEIRRKDAIQNGQAPRYDNRCRHLTDEQIKKFEQEGRKPVIRFKMPEENIVVKDLIRGDVEFDHQLIGDFVIFKSDGGPSFHFAVVVDDIEMKISHVIRGEDHLPNTPRHIALFHAFGCELPLFAHMSMTMGPDGTRLSKRHGATSVNQYRELGYLPDAFSNFLALLGWSPGDDREILTRDELIDLFSIEGMTKSSAIFGIDKLNWMNGMYIRQAPIDKLTRLAIPYLQKGGYYPNGVNESEFVWISKVVDAVRGYLNCLSEIPQHAALFMNEEVEIEEASVEFIRSDEGQKVLQLFQSKIESMDTVDIDAFKSVLKDIQGELDVKGKQLYMPLRIALTGKKEGLELHVAVALLEKKKILQRIQTAQARPLI
ncbi:glutamate--tRNA ligase [PVC group bacterium]|nr:glutamate--tRNA ligase [PVC group bacterium]